MKIEIRADVLRSRSLFVATPMYGGNCTGVYTRSIAELARLCQQQGIRVYFHFMYNESLIQRARNYCVDEFLRSDCTHMLFIDADIAFRPKDVIAMLALQDTDSTKDPYDILAAPYPKKCISWEKIKTAVDKGFADEDPDQLARFVGDYVFNPVSGSNVISVVEPVEVGEAGTGFMMIRRQTFERFAAAYPEQEYTPDHIRSEHLNGDRKIVAYFDTPICPDRS